MPILIASLLMMLLFEALLAVLFAFDFTSTLATLAVGSVPLILYYFKIRQDGKKSQVHSSDRIMELTAMERSRLELERSSLRKEEREFMQREIDRYGRMAELARSRSHILANGFSELELTMDKLINCMRDTGCLVPSELKPDQLRNDIRRKLDALASREAAISYEANQDQPPETLSPY